MPKYAGLFLRKAYFDGVKDKPYWKENVLLKRDKWGYQSFFNSPEEIQEAFQKEEEINKTLSGSSLYVPLEFLKEIEIENA